MPCEKILNFVGLLVGLVGGLILFLRGPLGPDRIVIQEPVLNQPPMRNRLMDSGLQEQYMSDKGAFEKNEKLRKSHIWWSRRGFALIVLSFFFQLVALVL
jgi:hypothetical protein